MIFIILILGLILRLINLNQSLWLDEAISLLAVRDNSYWDLINKFSLGDFHPPLYYLVLKFTSNIFGYLEIASRIPSIIFGLAACYFTFLTGKKILNKQAGLLGALFLAINPLAIYYSQEARMYSLVMFCVTAAVYFFITKKWVGFVLFLTLSLYSDYLAWFMLPVFFLATKKRRALSAMYFMVFILLIPWLPNLWSQLQTGLSLAGSNPLWTSIAGDLNIKSILLIPVKFNIGRISFDNKILYAILIIPVVIVNLLAFTRSKNKFLWLWLIIPIIIGIFVSVKVPVFSYFRFLFILPAFCLLIAIGSVKNKALAVGTVVIFILSLAVFNFNSKFHRENWREAVNYMEEEQGVVVMPSLAQAAPIYYYQSYELPKVDKDNLEFGTKIPVYLVRYVQEIFDPQDFEKRALEISGYKRVEEKSFNGVVVWKYYP